MNKKKIKRKIEEHELFNNGLHMINGADVRAVNLKLTKGGIAVCDIQLISEDGVERHNNCSYDLKALGWI